MGVRTARWLLFLVFACTVPVPMWGPFDAFVPAARYVLLLAAAAALAAAEGAAGPVPGILALLGVHAAAALGLAGLGAWLGARLLGPLSPAARRNAVLAGGGALLLAALALELYRTPFGRAPTANLLGVLS